MNLDAAVPAIPPGLRTAPIAAVRRRARRRRALVISTATGGAALALVAAVAVTLPVWRESAAPPPGTTVTSPRPSVTVPPAQVPPQTSVPPGTPATPWQLARVNRDDRTVTVYVSPGDGDCMEVVGAAATYAVESDRVVITAYGTDRRANDCTRSGNAAPVRITLPEPLGGRPLIDVTTGGPRQAYPDRALPVVPPEKWSEVPTEYGGLTGDLFGISYTRAGGPDLSFRMSPAEGPPPSGSAAERIVVGGRPAVLSNVNGSWTLRWRSDGLDLRLQLVTNESVTSTTRDYARGVIEELGW